jgi:F-type H+-transporting ATPase subunit alpha
LGANGLLRNVPVEKVRAFEEDFLNQMEIKHPEVLESLRLGKMDDEALNKLKALATNVQLNYK